VLSSPGALPFLFKPFTQGYQMNELSHNIPTVPIKGFNYDKLKIGRPLTNARIRQYELSGHYGPEAQARAYRRSVRLEVQRALRSGATPTKLTLTAEQILERYGI
jgi:hypothetical protein